MSETESKKINFFKKLLLPLSCTLAFALLLITSLVIIRQRRISAISLESTISTQIERLVAKDSNARSGQIKERGQAQFAFTQQQKKSLFGAL